MSRETLTIRSTDNTALFIRKWAPESSSIGEVCLVHGLGEHSGRYEHVAQAFIKEGYTLFAYDQRGHGKSDGKRGDAPSYTQLLDDLQAVINKIKTESNELPLFLYGHSMGGNIVAGFLLERRQNNIKAALITSPWLTLSFNPPKWQVRLGRLILKLSPGMVQSNKLDPDELSRDKKVGTAYQNDPLVHNKISPRLYFEIHDAGLKILASAQLLKIPTLFVHGEKDPITSPQSSKVLAQDSGQEFKLWDELLHETHNELNKGAVIDFNIEWLNRQL